MVNIADVGFGVSQTLPILVALIQAKPEHTVYIEQPETHLHPKAQYQLAQLFAKAAQRGVRLIIETHSSLILQGIQTLVAKGELPPNDVALHWFSRDKSGATKVDSAKLDENGAFGDWPEDFDDTFLKADSAYLDAVESKF
jgi:predicted ATPase